MSRILITGSADGLGLFAAHRLIAAGHEVTLHARSERRAQDALDAAPGAAGALAGDLASLRETRALADAANASGRFDAVIHNAGVSHVEPRRIETEDGLGHVFQVNALAPYLLTALIERPDRLVYLSSGLHKGGDPALDDLGWARRPWNGGQAYADSKLFDAMLAFAVARHWPGVFANAVEPGWVATKMGGPDAPDDLDLGSDTQAWLAAGDDPAADVTGRYLFHRADRPTSSAARDEEAQERMLDAFAELTGTPLPD
jgi:NAD(P)-dependent dehydrogenase (short-subunit alcohol dehydrogenase family)